MRSLGSFGPLVGAVVVVLMTPVVHWLLAVSPTELEMLVLSYAPSVFVVLWVAADAQRRRCTPCHDFTFLMWWFLFPLTLLGYLLWTRGWRGLVVFVGLATVSYLPWIAGEALWMLAR